MREILFRGKRIDNGEWIYGSLVVAGDYCCILPADENSVHPTDYPYLDSETGTIDGHLIPVDPSTVGQYTGLTDKNGKKMFEGDIVVVPLSGKPAKGIVEYFKTDICGFVVITQPQYSNYVLQKNYTYEVIGNIHDKTELLDNPELLEDKP